MRRSKLSPVIPTLSNQIICSMVNPACSPAIASLKIPPAVNVSPCVSPRFATWRSVIYITPPTLRSLARPRPARRTPFVRSSLASAITDQLTVFTDSRGGPIFPVRSTPPLVIDGVVY